MQIKPSETNTMHLSGRKKGWPQSTGGIRTCTTMAIGNSYSLLRMIEGLHIQGKTLHFEASMYWAVLGCGRQWRPLFRSLSLSLSPPLSGWRRKRSVSSWVWWFEINRWQLEGRRSGNWTKEGMLRPKLETATWGPKKFGLNLKWTDKLVSKFGFYLSPLQKLCEYPTEKAMAKGPVGGSQIFQRKYC